MRRKRGRILGSGVEPVEVRVQLVGFLAATGVIAVTALNPEIALRHPIVILGALLAIAASILIVRSGLWLWVGGWLRLALAREYLLETVFGRSASAGHGGRSWRRGLHACGSLVQLFPDDFRAALLQKSPAYLRLFRGKPSLPELREFARLQRRILTLIQGDARALRSFARGVASFARNYRRAVPGERVLVDLFCALQSHFPTREQHDLCGAALERALRHELPLEYWEQILEQCYRPALADDLAGRLCETAPAYWRVFTRRHFPGLAKALLRLKGINAHLTDMFIQALWRQDRGTFVRWVLRLAPAASHTLSQRIVDNIKDAPRKLKTEDEQRLIHAYLDADVDTQHWLAQIVRVVAPEAWQLARCLSQASTS